VHCVHRLDASVQVAYMKPYDISKDFDKVLVNGLAVRAYVVSPCSEEERDSAVLVYAQCERTAVEIGAPELDGEPEGCEARHAPEHDARAAIYLAGQVEHDAEYMRDAGWHMQGEYSCGSCGLAAFGMEKYAVCRGCNLCKPCIGEDADEDEDGPCDHAEWGFSCE
jgi:hypothetical protein